MIKVLVDVENSVSMRDWSKLPSKCEVVMFISNRTQAIGPIIKEMGNNWTVSVRYVYSGIKNSMDVCILEYIWQDHIASDGTTEYIIVSNDKDFDYGIRECREQGIEVSRNNLGFAPPKAKSVPKLSEPVKTTDESFCGPNSDTSWLFEKETLEHKTPSKATEPETTEFTGFNFDFNFQPVEPEGNNKPDTMLTTRAYNKQRRAACREYLQTQAGFTAEQARIFCKSMSPRMVHIVMHPAEWTEEDKKTLLTRLHFRMNKLGIDEKKQEQMARKLEKPTT